MNDKYIFSEEVSFIQHHLPGLQAGSYRLSLSHTLQDVSGKLIGEEMKGEPYQFAVQGDRFRVNAPGKVFFSVFPAANAVGEFTTVLPHVVFSKKTFSWIRYPDKDVPAYRKKENLSPGKSPEKDVSTWLWILLLDEDDLHGDFQNLSVQNRTIGDLFPGSSSLGDNISYFHGQPSSQKLEYGESKDDQIQTIDLPLELFWKVAPTLEDLKYTAHARKVSLDNKSTIPGISDQGQPTGDFSIVFGNRLPQSDIKTHAYLVSLEGMEAFLPTEDGTPQASAKQYDGKNIRLAALKSWSFYSTGETATFVDTLMALNGGSAAASPKLSTLQVPYHGIDPTVKSALQMGYAPLNHFLRTGENTVSWFRGPLVPYPITKAELDFPISSPDKATAFDPNTGLLDVSYAVAWTLGRLLALQEKSFSTSLYKWKKETNNRLLALIEDALILEKFGELATVEEQLKTLQGKEKTTAIENLYHNAIQWVLNGVNK